MFTKVLVAEDLEAINKGMHAVLKDLKIPTIHSVQYCDDAFLKIKKAEMENSNYELLITDLSFVSDYRNQKIVSGEQLVNKVKQEFPYLKVIVYTVEDRFQKVRELINIHKANAYVCKSRTGLTELKKAINMVYEGKGFLSNDIQNALNQNHDLEIHDYDIELLKQLSLGLSQSQISSRFSINCITPNSLSSIEKKINKLKDQFRANNTIHLVTIVKDLGLI